MGSYGKIAILLQQGRFGEAEAASRAAIGESVDDPMLFHFLAASLLNQDKPKEAERAARQSISLDPDFDLGYFSLARTLIAQDNEKAALEAIREALLRDPEDPDYFALKAQIQLNRRKFAETLAAADEGLALDPSHDGCRFFRGAALEHLGRSEEAEDVSLDLLADDPEDPEHHNVRGWILIQRGDHAGAEEHFLEALRLSPDYDDARQGLSLALKLRNPFLGWLLRIILWFGRLPFWWAVIGIVIAMQLGDKLEDSSLPAPLPQIGSSVRILLYFLFVMMLIAEPLFTAVIAASRRTRHALSRRKLAGVKWYVLPLVLSLFYLGRWILNGGGGIAPLPAIGWASIAALVHEVFETERGWVVRRLALISGVATLILVVQQAYLGFVVVPELVELLKEMQAIEEGEKPPPELAKEFSVTYKRLLDIGTWPILLLWLAGSFSDDIRHFLTRRSPD